MSVGKGSLVRASKVNTGKKENAENIVQTPKETLIIEVKAKPAEKIENIHEKKFEAVSNIKSDLPVHLL